LVPSGPIVAVAGTAPPGAVGLLFATSAAAAATAASAFAFFRNSNHLLLYYFTTYYIHESVAEGGARAKPHSRRCNACEARRKAGAKKPQ